MPLGTEIGLGPGHTVLDGDPVAPYPPPRKGHSSPPLFVLHLLWPNGWMRQDTTWYGGRPRLRRPCVRRGDPAPPTESSIAAPLPDFSARVYCGETIAQLSNC